MHHARQSLTPPPRQEQAAGYKKKDFIQAKHDFVDRMIQFAGVSNPGSILDVGCGIGGTTRMLASRFPGAKVAGKLTLGL